MGNVIATSIERMNTDINTYDRQIRAVETAFNDAWAAVNELNSTWAGPAHDTLVAQFEADQEIMQMLLTSLRNYRDELDSAKREYQTCEGNVDSLIRSMQV